MSLPAKMKISKEDCKRGCRLKTGRRIGITSFDKRGRMGLKLEDFVGVFAFGDW